MRCAHWAATIQEVARTFRNPHCRLTTVCTVIVAVVIPPLRTLVVTTLQWVVYTHLYPRGRAALWVVVTFTVQVTWPCNINPLSTLVTIRILLTRARISTSMAWALEAPSPYEVVVRTNSNHHFQQWESQWTMAASAVLNNRKLVAVFTRLCIICTTWTVPCRP